MKLKLGLEGLLKWPRDFDSKEEVDSREKLGLNNVPIASSEKRLKDKTKKKESPNIVHVSNIHVTTFEGRVQDVFATNAPKTRNKARLE
jgi:hypothetical protein